MKKIIATVLLLAIALCLCACGDNNREPRFVGTWQTDDGSVTMTLNEDGTATLEVTGEDAATYSLKWTADSVSSLTLNWDGTPVLATEDNTEDDGIETDTTEEIIDEAEEAEEIVEDVEIPVETSAGEDDAATATTKRIDSSTIGFASLKLISGELWLTCSEGTSEDILLFIYSFKKIA